MQAYSPTLWQRNNAGDIKRYYCKCTLSGPPFTLRVERLPPLLGCYHRPTDSCFPDSSAICTKAGGQRGHQFRAGWRKARGISGMEGKMGCRGLGNQMSPGLQAQRSQTTCLVLALEKNKKSPLSRILRQQKAPRAERRLGIKAGSTKRDGRLSSKCHSDADSRCPSMLRVASTSSYPHRAFLGLRAQPGRPDPRRRSGEVRTASGSSDCGDGCGGTEKARRFPLFGEGGSSWLDSSWSMDSRDRD